MRKTTSAIILLIVIFFLVSGCAAEPEKRDVRSSKAKSSVESTLVKEIEGGKIVEVYDEYVRLGAGETKENWLIINNVKDAGDTFSIQPCSGCEFDKTTVDISLGKYSIIKFTVSADAGEKEIRVKDSHSNAYGFAKINVIIE
jgi:hypothetical protein